MENIAGLRNILIHQYFWIDLLLLWNVINKAVYFAWPRAPGPSRRKLGMGFELREVRRRASAHCSAGATQRRLLK